MDEVHDVLNGDKDRARQFMSLLKDFLEPDQKTFKDEALGLDIDVSQVIFILAGNEEVSERGTTNAFRSRFSTLRFPRISLENRNKIALKTAEKLAIQFQYELTEEDIEMIRSLVSIDTNEGVRVIKRVIREYLNYQRTKTKDWFVSEEGFDVRESFMRNGSVELK